MKATTSKKKVPVKKPKINKMEVNEWKVPPKLVTILSLHLYSPKKNYAVTRWKRISMINNDIACFSQSQTQPNK